MTNTFFIGFNLGNIAIELRADEVHTIGTHGELDGEYRRRMLHWSPFQDSRKTANKSQSRLLEYLNCLPPAG